MPRSIRIEFSGAFYHVMARGNRLEAIYCDDDDRRYFLKTLGEACSMTGWRIHGWPNICISAARETPASKSVATVGNHRRWPANSKSGWRSP